MNRDELNNSVLQISSIDDFIKFFDESTKKIEDASNASKLLIIDLSKKLQTAESKLELVLQENLQLKTERKKDIAKLNTLVPRMNGLLNKIKKQDVNGGKYVSIKSSRKMTRKKNKK